MKSHSKIKIFFPQRQEKIKRKFFSIYLSELFRNNLELKFWISKEIKNSILQVKDTLVQKLRKQNDQEKDNKYIIFSTNEKLKYSRTI